MEEEEFSWKSIFFMFIACIVGIYYAICCYKSTTQAIHDRKEIIRRNMARRKARSFKNSFKERHNEHETQESLSFINITSDIKAVKQNENLKNGKEIVYGKPLIEDNSVPLLSKVVTEKLNTKLQALPLEFGNTKYSDQYQVNNKIKVKKRLDAQYNHLIEKAHFSTNSTETDNLNSTSDYPETLLTCSTLKKRRNSYDEAVAAEENYVICMSTDKNNYLGANSAIHNIANETQLTDQSDLTTSTEQPPKRRKRRHRNQKPHHRRRRSYDLEHNVAIDPVLNVIQYCEKSQFFNSYNSCSTLV